MANPVKIECAADVWTMVAENVTGGQIKREKTSPNVYLSTYKMTGGTAPIVASEGSPIFLDGISEIISSSTAIDVYIMPLKVAGSVKAELP